MPEPQGSAPQEMNKDRTNFSKAGMKAGVSPTRLDQTSGAMQKSTPMRSRPASPGGKG